MIGSDITAEIATKIGRVLTSKWPSRSASRAALPATNDATTISAQIVASRAVPRWSSCCAMALSGHLRAIAALGSARLVLDQLVVQAAGARRQQQPDRRQRDVHRGERLHAEVEHLDHQEHDA